MSEEKEQRKPFTYNFRAPAKREDELGGPRGGYDTLVSIEQSLLLMTEGCDIVPRSEGYFCQRHQRKVTGRSERCDFLADRFNRAKGGTESKAQLQDYINDILGIKDPKSVKRLMGQPLERFGSE